MDDPTYDLLQYMLNFPGRLVVDPSGFALRMADLLDLDADRLPQWLLARCDAGVRRPTAAAQRGDCSASHVFGPTTRSTWRFHDL